MSFLGNAAELTTRPLAWTAPKPEELPGQLENVRRAFQLLYGHSDADVYFHPWMFSKQGHHSMKEDKCSA